MLNTYHSGAFGNNYNKLHDRQFRRNWDDIALPEMLTPQCLVLYFSLVIWPCFRWRTLPAGTRPGPSKVPAGQKTSAIVANLRARKQVSQCLHLRLFTRISGVLTELDTIDMDFRAPHRFRQIGGATFGGPDLPKSFSGFSVFSTMPKHLSS